MSETIAEIHNATKTYNGINVVDGLNLSLKAGRTTVLVGPNGCGKSTTMEMLVGLRRFTRGGARICGIPVQPRGNYRSFVGVQLQSSGLPAKIRVHEVIRAVSCLYAEPADWEPMARGLGMESYLHSYADSLSGGQRRRLDILCASIGRPRLLVLDEPTSGIDPDGRSVVWDFIRSLSAQGCAVFASTHDMAEAESFSDELLIMAAGKIRAAGTVQEILNKVGGNTRLRISGPGPEMQDTIRSSGLKNGHSGNSVVVIGEPGELDSLQAQFTPAQKEQTDIMRGPVRLEDVFAVLSAEMEPETQSAGSAGK